jgi:hypothetical protein
VVVADLGEHPRSGEPADAGEAVHDGPRPGAGRTPRGGGGEVVGGAAGGVELQDQRLGLPAHSGLDQW